MRRWWENWSGRPDSNRRHRPWQGRTLTPGTRRASPFDFSPLRFLSTFWRFVFGLFLALALRSDGPQRWGTCQAFIDLPRVQRWPILARSLPRRGPPHNRSREVCTDLRENLRTEPSLVRGWEF